MFAACNGTRGASSTSRAAVAGPRHPSGGSRGGRRGRHERNEAAFGSATASCRPAAACTTPEIAYRELAGPRPTGDRLLGDLDSSA